jgi:chemotaxis protein methyltransferase CheR
MRARGTAEPLSEPREPAPPRLAGHRSLSQRDFRLFQRLVYREAGIHLSDVKRVLVEGRLSRRLRELDLDFRGYYALVERDEPERIRLVDAISTNETHFFREPRQFEFLERVVYPEWEARAAASKMPRRVRVWSAACSTGEEPYSVAMSFLARFPPESGWQIEILATDISTRVLERARAGLYDLGKSKEIPARFLRAFMLKGKGPQEGRMKAGPEIRSLVRFSRVNLNAASLAVAGPFDLILCRNVLIYFDAPSKARVLDRLLERLDGQGHLLLGHAEAMVGMNARTRSVGPTVYVHAASRKQDDARHDSGIRDVAAGIPDARGLEAYGSRASGADGSTT